MRVARSRRFGATRSGRNIRGFLSEISAGVPVLHALFPDRVPADLTFYGRLQLSEVRDPLGQSPHKEAGGGTCRTHR